MSSAERPSSGSGEGSSDRLVSALRQHEREREGEDRWARYERLERLGSGGMATVYRARERDTGREVAIKQLLSPKPEALLRLKKEARALGRLSHPNVVAIHELLESPPAIVMELVSGEPLSVAIERGGRDLGSLVLLVAKVARAVQHAHEQGVIHRDLKPANILVTGSFEPKVADFGIAVLEEDGERLTRSGVLLGTLLYMSPEQAAGKIREIDARTDVYALGAILYEALSGGPPFRADSPTALARAIVLDRPVPPRRLAPETPAALEAVALRALEKEPDDRHQTAAEFAEELERWLADPAEPAPARLAAPGLALAVLAAVAVLVVVLARAASSPAAAPEKAATKSDPTDLETRVRSGRADLAELARDPSSAALLRRLASSGAVLQHGELEKTALHAAPECREPLRVLEAIALVASGADPDRSKRALAMVKGARYDGVAAALFDAVGAVLRVHEALVHEGELDLVGASNVRLAGDALAKLEPLGGRPELLAGAVAPLASDCRDAVVKWAVNTRRTDGLDTLLTSSRALQDDLDRLPPEVASACLVFHRAGTGDLGEPAERLARTIDSRDPLLAGTLYLLAVLDWTMVWREPERCASDTLSAEHLLEWGLAGTLSELERAAALADRWRVAHLAVERAVRAAHDASTDGRRLALERAAEAADLAVARGESSQLPEEIEDDTHRAFALKVILGDLDGARRIVRRNGDDPLFLLREEPVDARALAASASRVLAGTPTVPVRRSALVLRARARAVLGETDLAALDEKALAGWTVSSMLHDLWLDRLAVEARLR